ncbi:preprotein translocase subunit SecE [Candidatus Erwinia haradaeae]|uniref:Protein translocase subunit SecE n=1 Tax=Candidatus Erwinia haradaeae TaxID=1922217 RepID=A0A451DI41_9GAMM|nr:preprotein translocase subunit SecE [Candidatus Erwinia haradaeae]VFP86317.1 Protein translocase subunit SecE [Candidatus Erwinia haradaeae]
MNDSIEDAPKKKKKIEIYKWLGVTLLIVTAIIGNVIYHDILFPVRVLVIMLLMIAAIILALFTIQGKTALNFTYQAHNELRKIIWPTRQETFHTTFIVSAVTAIMSFILWGLDSILVRLVSFITGLRF